MPLASDNRVPRLTPRAPASQPTVDAQRAVHAQFGNAHHLARSRPLLTLFGR